jgi:hypothetical protein
LTFARGTEAEKASCEGDLWRDNQDENDDLASDNHILTLIAARQVIN